MILVKTPRTLEHWRWSADGIFELMILEHVVGVMEKSISGEETKKS